MLYLLNRLIKALIHLMQGFQFILFFLMQLQKLLRFLGQPTLGFYDGFRFLSKVLFLIPEILCGSLLPFFQSGFMLLNPAFHTFQLFFL